MKTYVDFPAGPVLRLQTPQWYPGGPASIPGQGTRSHMLKLRVYMLQFKKKKKDSERKKKSHVLQLRPSAA